MFQRRLPQQEILHIQAKCEWGLSPSQESLITSVVFVGTMSGAYAWGSLGDAKGRRLGFFATALLTFSFGVLSALAPSYGVGLGPQSNSIPHRNHALHHKDTGHSVTWLQAMLH